VSAAIAKPLPRAALLLSALSMLIASGAWLSLHDKRIVLVLPMLLLWLGGVWPLARTARLSQR